MNSCVVGPSHIPRKYWRLLPRHQSRSCVQAASPRISSNFFVRSELVTAYTARNWLLLIRCTFCSVLAGGSGLRHTIDSFIGPLRALREGLRSAPGLGKLPSGSAPLRAPLFLSTHGRPNCDTKLTGIPMPSVAVAPRSLPQVAQTVGQQAQCLPHLLERNP